MNEVVQYATSINKKIIKKYCLINFSILGVCLIILLGINFTLANSEDVSMINKVILFLVVAGGLTTFSVPFILKAKSKASFSKLPLDIDKEFKAGVRFRDIQNFIFADDGVIAFNDAVIIYIKYVDIQRAYVYKMVQKALFINFSSQYYINIESIDKNYSIPVKLKDNNKTYTEQDFLDLTYELHNRNENITLDGVLQKKIKI